MEHVESFDLFGAEVRQLPCRRGTGAPTASTIAAVGDLYMDTNNGELYKCTAVAEGVYTWVPVGTGSGGDSIVCEASGSTISITDSTNKNLQGLNLYGKTTQNGTPTPEAPIELESVGAKGNIGVTVAGKNLLDKSSLNIINNYYINSSGVVAESNNLCYFEKRLAAGTYTFSVYNNTNAENTTRIHAYDANGTWIKQLATQENSANPVVTFTVPYNAQSIRFSLPKLSTSVILQIEVGSNGTEYEPYNAQTLTANKPTEITNTPNGFPGVPVSSGGNYTDENGQQWICDEIDFARGVYVQRVLLVDSFRLAAEKTNTTLYRRDCTQKLIGQTTKAALCTVTGTYAYADSDSVHFYVQDVVIWVYAPKGFDNSNNVIKALVALQEPVKTALSAEELAAYAALHTNKPNTTVLNDAGAGMAAKYVADTKTYIDNKFNALSATLTALTGV